MSIKKEINKHFIGNWKLVIGNSVKLTLLVFPVMVHAGVISDAPRISEVLLKAFNFLLSVFGIIAIICLVIAGALYLTAGGDQPRIEKAKKAFFYAVTGIIVGLGCLIIMKTLGKIIAG